MKLFTTATVGALALTTALAVAEPAAARSNVGVYIGPNGVAISIDRERRYCRDEFYRRRHWDSCHRFYGNGYYNSNYRSSHHRHRHWNNYHRRWDWD